MSRICPDLRWFAVQAVDQNSADHFNFFCLSEMRSVELKTHKIHFRADSAGAA